MLNSLINHYSTISDKCLPGNDNQDIDSQDTDKLKFVRERTGALSAPVFLFLLSLLHFKPALRFFPLLFPGSHFAFQLVLLML